MNDLERESFISLYNPSSNVHYLLESNILLIPSGHSIHYYNFKHIPKHSIT